MGNASSIIYTIAQSLPGFLMAVCFHEWAHAYAAHKFGDDTAKNEGRLSLNPLVHLDMMGTVILPIILISVGSMAFGYAKPVPVNARNFKDNKKSIFWVSFAGPLANGVLVILSAFFLALVAVKAPADWGFKIPLVKMLSFSLHINVVLGAFNLIPFPPLDGSQMLKPFLSYENQIKYDELSRYTFMIFMGLIALSYMGGPNIIGYMMAPFAFMAQFVAGLFFKMLI
jgi:Zn-dependent protease